jgi:signal transduction histidine kinase
MLIPMVTPGVTDSAIFGVLVLRIDPVINLFPIIQSWPTPSKSSETLLLRRDGDSVLYLNELRHQKNTAMRLSLPLTNQELPAAKAALGFEGEFEGFDYRRIQVISYLKKVPDSPWFMVAKVDKNEIYAPLYKQLTVISLIGALLIFIASALVGFIWRTQRVRYLRNQLELELKRNEALEALKESEVRLRELNATKDKFFSIISHDLKSPFNSIIGLSELLAEKMRNKDYDGIEEYSTIIQNSSWRAMDLLSNLIVWSRLQTGRIEFRPELIEIEELITQVTELSKDSAKQKNITFNREAPLNVHVFADKEMIYSVLRNLVSNAIKFTGKGGTIGISAVLGDDELEISVTDNGIGIKKEVMDKLFRIGESVSTPGTMKEEGTGLGLILCKDFVQKHGGKIWGESEVGKGSRFIFTIPVRN